MELIKRQIQMNRIKGRASTQVTMDDDFIVPDTMDDCAQVLLGTGGDSGGVGKAGGGAGAD